MKIVELPGNNKLKSFGNTNNHIKSDNTSSNPFDIVQPMQYDLSIAANVYQDVSSGTKLNYINGDLLLTSSQSTTGTFGEDPILEDAFPNLIRINGSLIISYTELILFNGFKNLEYLEDLIIYNNPLLEKIPVFPKLKKVRRIIIANNNSLKLIVGFEHLIYAHSIQIFNKTDRIIGFIELLECNKIDIFSEAEIIGFTNIRKTRSLQIGGSVKFDAFRNLEISDSVTLVDNSANIQLFLKMVDHLSIINNTGFVNLPQLNTVGHLIFDNNSTQVLNFNLLKSASSILISNNKNLEKISFQSLAFVGCNNVKFGLLEFPEFTWSEENGTDIDYQYEYKTKELFNELEKVNYSIIISNNEKLINIENMLELKTVVDSIIIINNALTKLDNFNDIKTLTNVYVKNNNLTSFKSLLQLQSAQEIVILEPNLEQVNFPKLQTVQYLYLNAKNVPSIETSSVVSLFLH